MTEVMTNSPVWSIFLETCPRGACLPGETGTSHTFRDLAAEQTQLPGPYFFRKNVELWPGRSELRAGPEKPRKNK